MRFSEATVLFIFFEFSDAIRCYQCDADRAKYLAKPCLLFNGTDTFIKDCPLSSMCYKKIIHLDMGNGMKASTIQRDCAAQTQRDEQRKVGRKWEQVRIIYEVYDEGCAENEDLQKATRSIHCYCRGDLCNGSRMIHGDVLVVLIGLMYYGIVNLIT